MGNKTTFKNYIFVFIFFTFASCSIDSKIADMISGKNSNSTATTSGSDTTIKNSSDSANNGFNGYQNAEQCNGDQVCLQQQMNNPRGQRNRLNIDTLFQTCKEDLTCVKTEIETQLSRMNFPGQVQAPSFDFDGKMAECKNDFSCLKTAFEDFMRSLRPANGGNFRGGNLEDIFTTCKEDTTCLKTELETQLNRWSAQNPEKAFSFDAAFKECKEDLTCLKKAAQDYMAANRPQGNFGNGPGQSGPGHTIDKGGILHNAGIEAPETNCIQCHGADLKGGRVGVSCFSCHGKNWN